MVDLNKQSIDIQLISNSNYFDRDWTSVKINKFHDFEDFDSYKYTVIDLNHEDCYKKDVYELCPLEDDLDSLSGAISNSKKTRMIFLLPQNIRFEDGHFKDFLFRLNSLFKDKFNVNLPNLNYGKCKTKIGKDIELDGAFYFSPKKSCEVITKNINSNITTIKIKEMYITTLDLIDHDEITDFIKYVVAPSNAPDWFNEIKMFDDEQQLKIIEDNKKQIQELELKIEESNKILEKNNHYKSILFKKSKELVKIVFEIIEELLDYDLSNFKDEFKEDFLMEFQEVTFIGEIKGVSSNLRRDHLSQLDYHIERRKEDLKEKSKHENIKPLLIINRFIKYSPKNRKPIEQEHIDLATTKFDPTLIITVEELLKLYEMYKFEEITKDEIFKKLKDEKGLFKI